VAFERVDVRPKSFGGLTKGAKRPLGLAELVPSDYLEDRIL
jgi:hypothetical protein